jgi:hypothetical protein
MIKTLSGSYIILALIFSLNSSAGEVVGGTATSAGAPAGSAVTQQASSPPPPAGTFENDCSKFIQSNGQYGSAGNTIANALTSDTSVDRGKTFKQALLGPEVNNDILVKNLCPSFGSLDEKAKTKFWVWTFAAIADAESQCGHQKNNGKKQCSKDQCIGIMQMDDELSHRRVRGPHCNQASVADDNDNIMCAMDIMRGQATNQYAASGGGQTTWKSFYWELLRTNGDSSKIKDAIKKDPDCESSAQKTSAK